MKVKPSKKLAALSCHSTANFTEAKSLILSVLNNLGYDIKINESADPSFIPGRVASVTATSNNSTIDTDAWYDLRASFVFGSGTIRMYVNNIQISGNWTSGSGTGSVTSTSIPVFTHA